MELTIAPITVTRKAGRTPDHNWIPDLRKLETARTVNGELVGGGYTVTASQRLAAMNAAKKYSAGKPESEQIILRSSSAGEKDGVEMFHLLRVAFDASARRKSRKGNGDTAPQAGQIMPDPA